MDYNKNRAEDILQQYVSVQRGKSVEIGLHQVRQRPAGYVVKFAAVLAVPVLLGLMVLVPGEEKIYGYVNEVPVTDRQEALELTKKMIDEMSVADGNMEDGDILGSLFKL